MLQKSSPLPPSLTRVNSNADAVVEQEDGTLLFVEPHQKQERFVDFLSYVRSDSSERTPAGGMRNVKYAQTRQFMFLSARASDPSDSC